MIRTFWLLPFLGIIAGFGAVSKDPVMNAVIRARRERLIASGLWTDALEKSYSSNKVINQQIITGTADYDFGHYYKYWKRY